MSRHFLPAETRCRCGCGFDLTDSVKEALDLFRDHMGFALSLSSGARCENWNKAEGGKPASYHLLGRAADIRWSNFNGAAKAKMLAYAVQHFSGIGLSKDFLHVDDGSVKKVWFY